MVMRKSNGQYFIFIGIENYKSFLLDSIESWHLEFHIGHSNIEDKKNMFLIEIILQTVSG
jgi:hypothetical protein